MSLQGGRSTSNGEHLQLQHSARLGERVEAKSRDRIRQPSVPRGEPRAWACRSLVQLAASVEVGTLGENPVVSRTIAGRTVRVGKKGVRHSECQAFGVLDFPVQMDTLRNGQRPAAHTRQATTTRPCALVIARAIAWRRLRAAAIFGCL